MNIYIYGPKDDPYHRNRWRENYPADKAAELKRLIEAAHKYKVQFTWALHPGLDIKWNKTDSLNVLNKLEASTSWAAAALPSSLTTSAATAARQPTRRPCSTT